MSQLKEMFMKSLINNIGQRMLVHWVVRDQYEAPATFINEERTTSVRRRGEWAIP